MGSQFQTLIEECSTFKSFLWNMYYSYTRSMDDGYLKRSEQFPNLPLDESYRTAIAELKEQIEAIAVMTPQQISHEIDELYESQVRIRNSYFNKAKKLRGQYEELERQIGNWHPINEEQKHLKDFMFRWVEKALEWDCNMQKYNDNPERMTKGEWIRRRITALSDSIEMLEKQMEGSDKTIDRLNKEIDDLLISIGE